MSLIGNDVRDIGLVNKVDPNAMIHRAEKPVEIAVWAVQYSWGAVEHVPDLFGGSGLPLIAAEQALRSAYRIKPDPSYNDAVVQRWEKFTGREVERLLQ